MIVGGGFWALYEYSALLEQERAIATVQLNKVKADEIRAKLVPKLSLYIKERFLLDLTGQIWLAATVDVVNEGLDGTTMDISLEPFRIAKVESISEDGKVNVGTIRFVGKLKLRSSEEASDGNGQTANVTHISVQAGRSTQIPFLVDLKSRGIYYLEFRAKMTDKSKKEWVEIGMPPDKTVNWAVSKYVTTETIVDNNIVPKP